MNFYNYQISKNIFSLNRYVKRALAILVDIMICIITFWLALYLRLEEFILFKNLNLTPVILSILIAIPIFGFLVCTGLYFDMRAYQFFYNINIYFCLWLNLLFHNQCLWFGKYTKIYWDNSTSFIICRNYSFKIFIKILINGYFSIFNK